MSQALDVTNDEFIRAIFGDRRHALVCVRPGDPMIKGAWVAKAWPCSIPIDTNNYLCGGVFKSNGVWNSEETFSATHANATGCAFIMLDDVGTKVPMARLGDFKPSWILETSPGNYQVGIILSETDVDLNRLTLVHKAIRDAGLCDPGASSPLTRWSRLPLGVNGKASYCTPDPFRCRLIEFAPDRRYTLDEIIDGLGIRIEAPKVREWTPRLEASGSDVEEMLAHISPVEREMWLRIGMALHFEGHPQSVWDRWSQGAPDAYEQRSQNATWRGFEKRSPNAVTMGTIIHHARLGGWKPAAAPIKRYAGPSNKPLIVTTNDEDGAAAREAGYEVIITDNLNRTEYLDARRQILLAVKDEQLRGVGARNRALAAKALRNLQRQNFKADLLFPYSTRRRDGSGLHDLLDEAGVEAVIARIEKVASPRRKRKVQYSSLRDVRIAMRKRIRELMLEAASWRPDNDKTFAPSWVLRIPAGVGKSEAYLQLLNEVICLMRKSNDKRSIVIAVPNHKLSDELLARYRRVINGSVRVAEMINYRGREAERPGSTEPMCANLRIVKEALRLGVTDIKNTICNERECKFVAGCPHVAQRTVADVVVVSHKMLFSKMPVNLAMNGVAMVLIDETSWKNGVLDDLTITVSELRKMPTAAQEDVSFDPLLALRQSLIDVIEKNPEGPVDLTSLTLDAGKGAAWERGRLKTSGHWRKNKQNATVASMVRLWESFADAQRSRRAQTGRLRIEWDEKAGERCIRVRGIQLPHYSWRAPTIHLDASADVDLLRYFWPEATLVDEFDVRSPFARIWQVDGKSFAKQGLEIIQGDDDESSKRRKDNKNARERVREFLLYQHVLSGWNSFVIGNKSVVGALELSGVNGMLTGHFNAIVGLDKMRNCRSGVVLGYPRLSMFDLHRQTEAITGDVVPDLGGEYPTRDGERQVRQGDEIILVPHEEAYHPHPVAFKILTRLCAEEIEQAKERARCVDRTADNPVDLFILNNINLPNPVDGLIPVEAVMSLPVEAKMLVAGGIAYENASSAATAYKPLLTHEMVRKSRSRRTVTSFIFKYNYEIGHTPLEGQKPGGAVEFPGSTLQATLQRSGAGIKPEKVSFDPVQVQDPWAKISQQIGPIKTFTPDYRQAHLIVCANGWTITGFCAEGLNRCSVFIVAPGGTMPTFIGDPLLEPVPDILPDVTLLFREESE